MVVVAGMEGALASLVGGITPAPVVAVPTSTGYGAALEGVTALLAMHASCAAGHHRGGHRQRLRRGVRRGPDAPVSGRPAGARTGRAHRRPGSTASPASPATWPSAAWSTPAPTSTRCSACSSGCRSAGGPSTSSRCCAAASPPPGPSSRCRTTWWCAPTPTSSGWSRRPACPTGWRPRALATFAALAEVEAGLHRRPVDQVHFHEVGGHDTIIDVVGHGGGARGARRRRGAGQSRWPPAPAWCGRPTGCSPTRRPAVVGLLRGRARPGAGTCRSS